ncbi:MAG: CobD/CbiB family protein [Burkholderiaceae bacterium]
MSFVAIFVALLLEQVRPLARANPIHQMLRSWVRWTGRNFDAGRPQHGWLTWGVAVLAPSLAVLAVYWALLRFAGWPAAVVCNIVVLYITLGFRQFSHHFTGIRDALESGDEERARQLLARWQQIETSDLPKREIVRQMVEFSVIAAHRHVFGVLAWFSVLSALGLGPAGAVFYRLCEFVPRYWHHKSEALLQPVSGASMDVASRAWGLVDWLPARITAVGFAVVGGFEEAIESWREYEQQGPVDNDGVILAATAGAINLGLGPAARRAHSPAAAMDSLADAPLPGAPRLEPEVGHLRTVVGLVWRTVVMWMVLLALLTLARLLG